MTVTLPEALSQLSIEALDLSVRSEHALKSSQIETFGQLVQLSDKALLDIRALGAKSLKEIRDTIEKVLESYGITRVSLEQYSTVESTTGGCQLQNRSPGGWEVPPHKEEALDSSVELLDLSVRATNALKRLRISTMRELVNYPKRELARSQNMGRTSITEIASKLVSHLSCDPSAQTSSCGEIGTGKAFQTEGVKEFIDKMLAVLPDRQRSVIADRYGLWDGIAETLQDIGDKLGLTRERIRQIEASGLKRIRRLNGHGTIKRFIFGSLRYEIEATKAVRFGIVTEEEAVVALARDSRPEAAGLAAAFLQDILLSDHSIFTDNLIRIEDEVYCVDRGTADSYLEILRLLELSLRSIERPLTETVIIKEFEYHGGDRVTQDQLGFARRILNISPKFARLRNGTIALSQWTEFSGQNAPALAEAALRLLGRPSHFRVIAEKANSIAEETRTLTDGTIHNALVGDGEKFIRVKSGTFGLAVWGLKKPPYVKDRLVELLATAGYPLPLWHLEQKVLEVCNCKPTSVRMTLDLNPKIFSRFSGDQYGLQIAARDLKSAGS